MAAIRAGAEAEAPIKERGQPTMKINTSKDAYNNAKKLRSAKASTYTLNAAKNIML